MRKVKKVAAANLPAAPKDKETMLKKREASTGTDLQKQMLHEASVSKKEAESVLKSSGSANLTSEKDYEKQILGNLNDPLLWIEYVSFMYKTKGLEEARRIMERALTIVNPKNGEVEKFKLWTAYLNLEFHFGTEISLRKVLERAKNANEPRKVLNLIINLYKADGNFEMASEFARLYAKKFSKKIKSWIYFSQFVYDWRTKAPEPISEEEAEKLLKETSRKAMQALPKTKHIRFLSQMAVLQYTNGDFEKGRTTFENILHDFDKRTDIWSMYLDQETKGGHVEYARNLFEKVIGLKLKPQKMKFLFKKFLEFESANGNAKRVEYVKKKAVEFVSSVTGEPIQEENEENSE
jgi:rRNA biogenesis protein RRP5